MNKTLFHYKLEDMHDQLVLFDLQDDIIKESNGTMNINTIVDTTKDL